MNDHDRLRVACLVAFSLLSAACNSLVGIREPKDPPPADAGADADTGVRGDGSADTGSALNADARDASDARDAADAADTGDARDGGDALPQVVIATTALPDARYNATYVFELSATGGGGGDGGAELIWALSGGALPDGLELEKDGTIHGRTLQKGTFDLDLTVSQAGALASAPKHFTLKVVTRKWLVYRANAEDSYLYSLYAVNLETSPTVSHKINGNLPAPTGSVNFPFEFSPDGRWLAYMGWLDASAGASNLYVVEMDPSDRDGPGDPHKVNEFGSVREFAWSPDSRLLAFSAEDGQGGIDMLVSKVDDVNGHPARIGDTLGTLVGVGFVTDDLLTFWIDEVSFSRRSAAGVFGPPEFVGGAMGQLAQRWPDLQSGLFRSQFDSCESPSWTLIDFSDLGRGPRELDGYVSVSPRRDYLAHRTSQDPGYRTYRIYSTWGTEPLATFSTESRDCSPGSWSHDGTMFVTGADDGHLQVTRLAGNTATTGPLAGDYGTVAENGPPVFSPDDRWLAFSTDTGAWLARNDRGTLGAPVGGGVPTVRHSEQQVAFSPDSKRLITGEPSATERAGYASLVDLKGTAPVVTKLIFPGARDGSAVQDLGWSVHSTEAAFIVRDGDYPSPSNLYIMNEAGGLVNVTRFTRCLELMTPPCEAPSAFRFQP